MDRCGLSLYIGPLVKRLNLDIKQLIFIAFTIWLPECQCGFRLGRQLDCSSVGIDALFGHTASETEETRLVEHHHLLWLSCK